MKPKVSIIIPVYNVESYLVECLESVVNQTLKDIEVICVDDGSKDNSGSILDQYAVRDNRVKVIHKENGGYGKAMNVGIDAATGDYIGIVEPDDYIELTMYETLYAKAKEFDLDLIKSDYCRFWHDGEEIKVRRETLDQSGRYYSILVNLSEDLIPYRFPMNTWSGIYKRTYLEQFHIRHNETPGASFQDNGFWLQTFWHAKRAMFLPNVFYHNRRDNPNSSVKSAKKVFCIKEEYDWIRKLLENDIELKNKFIGIYYLKKFHNYRWTFFRVDLKFKRMFLRTFHREFKRAFKCNEIDLSLFTDSEKKDLMLVIDNPMKFYREKLNRLPLTEKIFSVRNEGVRKVICIFGVKIKFITAKLVYRELNAKIEKLENEVNSKLK